MFKRYKAPGWDEVVKALRARLINQNALVELENGAIAVCLIEEETEDATVERRVRYSIIYPTDVKVEQLDIPHPYENKRIRALLGSFPGTMVVEKIVDAWMGNRMCEYKIERFRVHSDAHVEEIPLVQEVE